MTTIQHLNIEVTSRCNQRCSYCFNDSGPGEAHTPLSVQQWGQIVHLLQRLGLESVHLTGGEPFVWPGTIHLLGIIQESGLSTSILSNGYRIPEMIDKHRPLFCALTVAQISLDSLDPHIHNKRRGSNRAWADAVSAIQSLREVGVQVEVSAVVDWENLHEIPSIISFCERLSCRLLPRPIVPMGRHSAADVHGIDLLYDNLSELIRDSSLCVSDRFAYVPPPPPTADTAHLAGKFTVSPSGNLRHGHVLVSELETNNLRALIHAA